MNLPQGDDIAAGMRVSIVQKQDQRTGTLTEGIVQDILTHSPTHPHGIKVRLTTGECRRPTIDGISLTGKTSKGIVCERRPPSSKQR